MRKLDELFRQQTRMRIMVKVRCVHKLLSLGVVN
jgi:hypothetical protein